jgi:hypothetical protein
MSSRFMLAGVVGSAALVLGTGAGGSANVAALPPAKQAIVDKATQFGLGSVAPPTKDPLHIPAKDQGLPQPDQGRLGRVITGDVQVPLPAAAFDPTSEWVDVTDDIQTVIYAGASPVNGGAGALYVWTTDLAQGRVLGPLTGLYLSTGAGPLTLQAVAGSTVTFTSAHGAGSFDLTTRKFA